MTTSITKIAKKSSYKRVHFLRSGGGSALKVDRKTENFKGEIVRDDMILDPSDRVKALMSRDLMGKDNRDWLKHDPYLYLSIAPQIGSEEKFDWENAFELQLRFADVEVLGACFNGLVADDHAYANIGGKQWRGLGKLFHPSENQKSDIRIERNIGRGDQDLSRGGLTLKISQQKKGERWKMIQFTFSPYEVYGFAKKLDQWMIEFSD
jgi:hypothetical protein